jgi:hypothetical protein
MGGLLPSGCRCATASGALPLFARCHHLGILLKGHCCCTACSTARGGRNWRGLGVTWTWKRSRRSASCAMWCRSAQHGRHSRQTAHVHQAQQAQQAAPVPFGC